jgi:dihydroorotate dehydrogenase
LQFFAYHARHTHSRFRTLSLYSLLRPLLFQLDPEASHRLTFKLLRSSHALPGASAMRCRVPPLPTRIMGLELKNPVGLAAGLDKNADCVGPLADLGFGFLELGTVTPRAQAGNPAPRLFRLTAAHALINRLGFPNGGLDGFLVNLKRWQRICPIGINIGKNKDTPNERALDDYSACLRAVYAQADYVTVNISSPNTPGLRALQAGKQLDALLRGLAAERASLAATFGRRVPIALKIAPDLDDEQLGAIADLLVQHSFDAVIATNTTTARTGVEHEPLAREAGGLSGRPLKTRSTAVIRTLRAELRGRVPIIGVGGIEDAEDAWDKLRAGADAVQLYTALIYRGPAVVRQIVMGLAAKVRGANLADTLSALRDTR